MIIRLYLGIYLNTINTWYHCWPAAVLLVSAEVSKIIFPTGSNCIFGRSQFYFFPWECFIWQWYSRKGRPLSCPFNLDIILASSTIQIMIKPNILHVYSRLSDSRELGQSFFAESNHLHSVFLLHSPPCRYENEVISSVTCYSESKIRASA